MANQFPIPMTLKYNNCSVELKPELSNKYFPNGISVDVKTPDTVNCDVYAINQITKSAQTYVKTPKTVHYVQNIYASDGQICKQNIKEATLSGWFDTLLENLTPSSN